MREQAVSAAYVDDAAAAKQAPYALRHFPRFEQFLARQTTRVADRAGETMRERVVRKAIEIPIGQPPAGRRRENCRSVNAPSALRISQTFHFWLLTLHFRRRNSAAG